MKIKDTTESLVGQFIWSTQKDYYGLITNQKFDIITVLWSSSRLKWSHHKRELDELEILNFYNSIKFSVKYMKSSFRTNDKILYLIIQKIWVNKINNNNFLAYLCPSIIKAKNIL